MMEEDECDRRIRVAHRKMEQSSANSLQTLNECVNMGVGTIEELDRQADVMDRVERCLDEMDVDLEKSKEHVRVIRSPFGGIINCFLRRKPPDEVVESRPFVSRSVGLKLQPPLVVNRRASMGNAIVDSNLDEVEKALYSLKGIGEHIGRQLDDSDRQIDRVGTKVDRRNAKLTGINLDIKRELR